VIDWSILRPTQKGLAVEGQDDKLLVETFLDAGEKGGQWQDWRAKLVIRDSGGIKAVLAEVGRASIHNNIWGLIDRDWRTDNEISDLTGKYPQLLVLPRPMIENYCVDPDEFLSMLPKVQREMLNESETRSGVGNNLADWLMHGALYAILHENGAHDFCRGDSGYPNALLTTPPITDEGKIASILIGWHNQLEPTLLLKNYRQRAASLQHRTVQEHYRECINGKDFFNQIVVQQTLNKKFRQQDPDTWFKTLMSGCTNCPSDFAPLMSRLL